MAEEKIFTLNLRRGFNRVPGWRKSKRAAEEVRKQIMHYAKVSEVSISKWINEAIWAHGAKNPPAKLKLKVEVDKDKKTAKAELFELPARAKREAEKLKLTEDKKKKTEAAKTAKEEKEKKEEEFKKKKEDEQKKIEEAKKQKAQAKMTKEQEMALAKSQ